MISMISLMDASELFNWPSIPAAHIEPGPRKVVKNPYATTYNPNGERECARRLRQMIKPQLQEIYGALLADGSASLRAENGVSNT